MLRKGSHILARKASPPPNTTEARDTTVSDGQVVIAIEPVDCDITTLGTGARIVKIPFRALTKPFLEQTKAVLVLGPLVSPALDAMQIAERLGELGFRGTLRVMGPTLPNPALVAREIRTASGSKDITVEMMVEP
jgi:hypothetical protein